MRRSLRVAGMLVLIAAMGAAIGWQARGAVRDWRLEPRRRGWAAFVRGDRHWVANWQVSRVVIFQASHLPRMYDLPAWWPKDREPPPPEAGSLNDAWIDATARIVRISATYRECEFGRLRTTAIERSSTVTLTLVRGNGEITEEERTGALRLLYDDPIPITRGSEVDHLGGVIFERYQDRPTKVFLWWPLTLTIGQVLLAIGMVVAMLWLTRQVARELRGTSRAFRRERGLCLGCGYPVSAAVCPECGAATAR